MITDGAGIKRAFWEGQTLQHLLVAGRQCKHLAQDQGDICANTWRWATKAEPAN